MTLFQRFVLRFIIVALHYFKLTASHGFNRFHKDCSNLSDSIAAELRKDTYERTKKA